MSRSNPPANAPTAIKPPSFSAPSFEHPQSQAPDPGQVGIPSDDATVLRHRIDALEAQVLLLIANHQHDLSTDIIGLFEVVSVIPTKPPRNIYQQVKIYVSGTTYRLYLYDYNAHVWHYSTLT